MKKTTNKKRTAPATISAGTAEQSTSSEIFAAIGFQNSKSPEKSRELVFEGTHSDFRVTLVPEPIWYQVDAAEQAMYAAYNAGGSTNDKYSAKSSKNRDVFFRRSV